jgi:hypothetical protein
VTWPNVVALLILCATFFFTAWRAPLVLVILMGGLAYYVTL